jgi:alkylated DNA repair dioxygenase AlkB
MTPDQLPLFDTGLDLPHGFNYLPEVLSPEAEQSLLEQVRKLPFQDFDFQGYRGKRRVLSYGWHYDFNERKLRKAEELPPFLLPLRELAAAFAERAVEQFPHVLITEYGVGAGIGWHRDKGVFGEVVGISLLSPCLFRLRRKVGSRWERVSLRLEPRSAYLLRGPARSDWEHGIPEAETPRYSITFRSLRGTP